MKDTFFETFDDVNRELNAMHRQGLVFFITRQQYKAALDMFIENSENFLG